MAAEEAVVDSVDAAGGLEQVDLTAGVPADFLALNIDAAVEVEAEPIAAESY